MITTAETMRVRLTFTNEVLGSSPASKEVYRDFIASKAPDAMSVEDEIEAVGVDETADNRMTVFPRHDGAPCVLDYQIKGMFKDVCGKLSRAKASKSAKLRAYKKTVDGVIFVQPRFIPYNLPEGCEIGVCERPLRASTPQGERVALASSETVPEGTTIEFEILLMDSDVRPFVEEWLDYGELGGFGQWRNSGKGTFLWDELDKKGKVIGGNNEAEKR